MLGEHVVDGRGGTCQQHRLRTGQYVIDPALREPYRTSCPAGSNGCRAGYRCLSQIHFGEFFDASLLLPSWTGQPPWRPTSAEEPAQLSEIPAQCVEWILGLGEEEFGEPLAARSGVSRQKIREKRPRVAAAWRRLLRRGTPDRRCAEQVDGQRALHAQILASPRIVPQHAARHGLPSQAASQAG